MTEKSIFQELGKKVYNEICVEIWKRIMSFVWIENEYKNLFIEEIYSNDSNVFCFYVFLTVWMKLIWNSRLMLRIIDYPIDWLIEKHFNCNSYESCIQYTKAKVNWD